METEKWIIDANKYFKVLRDDIEINPMCFRRAIDHLHEMEILDVTEVAHGRKLLGRHPVNVVLTHQCNRCACYMLPQDNYCPNCGAHMDGGKQ